MSLCTSYQGNICHLRLVEESDAAFIFDLRRNKKLNYLNKISEDIEDQKKFIKQSILDFEKGNSGYYVIQHNENPEEKGLVRITDINNGENFNYHSLIVTDETKSNTVIESILICYQIGFSLLKKDGCGPFPVPRDFTKLNKFHKKMGFAEYVNEDDLYNYYFISSKKFSNRLNFYLNLGFGLKK